jgi:hypothetical protein
MPEGPPTPIDAANSILVAIKHLADSTTAIKVAGYPAAAQAMGEAAKAFSEAYHNLGFKAG